MLNDDERKTIAQAAGVRIDCVCLYCGHAAPDVEAGGIWYCPADRCHGPAGGAARHVDRCRDCKTKSHDGRVTLIEACEVFKAKHARSEP